MTVPQLIWTRAAEDLAEDRLLFDDITDVTWLPCITREDLLPSDDVLARLACQRFSGAAITSLRTAERCTQLLPLRSMLQQTPQVIALSLKIANRLQDAEIEAQSAPDVTDGAGLGRWITDHCKPFGPWLLPGPRKRAFDLASYLADAGYQVQSLDLYQTRPEARNADGRALGGEDRDRLARNLGGVVCFASPSAVDGFVELFAERRQRLESMLAIAIGSTTARRAAGSFRTVQTAPESTVAALAKVGAQAFTELKSMS